MITMIDNTTTTTKLTVEEVAKFGAGIGGDEDAYMAMKGAMDGGVGGEDSGVVEDGKMGVGLRVDLGASVGETTVGVIVGATV